MKHKVLLQIISIVTINIFVISCEKPKPILKIPEEMKEYIMFPEGSWWVYEDTITLDVDSIYLVKQVIDTGYCTNCGEIHHYEKLLQTFYSSTFNQNIDIYTNVRYCVFSQTYESIYTAFGGAIFVFEEDCFDICFLDTYRIDPIEYYNVIQCSAFLADTSYWAKNVGAIKFLNERAYIKDTISYFLLKRYYINN